MEDEFHGLSSQKVLDGLLDLDCIPCGMEYMPADNDDAWNAIKRLIDGCDYYVLIVAGRYGSVTKEGVSFTEKEYDYAVSKGIPVLPFLHKNPGSIPADKCEQTATSKKNLEAFRQRCRQERSCKFWDSPGDLKANVITSIVSAKKLHPKPGWVRANYIPDEGAAQQLNRLRDELERVRSENEALRAQNAALANPSQPELTIYSLRSEQIPINYRYRLQQDQALVEQTWPTTAQTVFSSLAGMLATSAQEKDISATLGAIINKVAWSGGAATVGVHMDEVRRLMLRLRHLGLVEKAPGGQPSYWTLTPHGEKIAIELIRQT
jgi:hypothetical protein